MHIDSNYCFLFSSIFLYSFCSRVFCCHFQFHGTRVCCKQQLCEALSVWKLDKLNQQLFNEFFFCVSSYRIANHLCCFQQRPAMTTTVTFSCAHFYIAYCNGFSSILITKHCAILFDKHIAQVFLFAMPAFQFFFFSHLPSFQQYKIASFFLTVVLIRHPLLRVSICTFNALQLQPTWEKQIFFVNFRSAPTRN